MNDALLMGFLAPQVLRFGATDSTMDASTTVIVCEEMSGFGDDYFNDKFYIQVLKNANSVGNAPEAEIRLISDYVSATGTFTTAAFSQNVEASDMIFVMHESEAILGRDDASNGVSTTNVVANADGSVAERLQYLQEQVAAISGITQEQVKEACDQSLDSEIPTPNTANSVNDILLDKLSPRLPGSGTISTLSGSDVKTQVDASLDTAIPTPNVANSVNDILLDKLSPRLPGSGTISTLTTAQVNTEVDAALDTAIPASPTSNSVNERIKTLDDNYTSTRAGKLDYLDKGIAASEAAIRGADSDTLKTLSDQIDVLSGASSFELLENATAGDLMALVDSSGTLKLKKVQDRTHVVNTIVDTSGTTSAFTKIIYDDKTDHFVILYLQASTSYPMYVVGKVNSDLTVTIGTPTVLASFSSAAGADIRLGFGERNIVLAYIGTTNTCYVRTCKIDPETMTLIFPSTAVVACTGTTGCVSIAPSESLNCICLVYSDSTKNYAIFYRQYRDYLQALGSATAINNQHLIYNSLDCDIDNDIFVVAGRAAGGPTTYAYAFTYNDTTGAVDTVGAEKSVGINVGYPSTQGYIKVDYINGSGIFIMGGSTTSTNYPTFLAACPNKTTLSIVESSTNQPGTVSSYNPRAFYDQYRNLVHFAYHNASDSCVLYSQISNVGGYNSLLIGVRVATSALLSITNNGLYFTACFDKYARALIAVHNTSSSIIRLSVLEKYHPRLGQYMLNESGTTGQTKSATTLCVPGGISSGHTDLVPGAYYYLNIDSNSLTRENTGYLVGRAISTTQIVIMENFFNREEIDN